MIVEELRGTTPWYVPLAVDALAELLPADALAFEWGCGGSTLWLAQRCRKVTSVEHNVEWYTKTYNELRQFGLGNVAMVYIPANGDYADYTAYIDRYDLGYFDLICVDGRNRADCLRHAEPRLKPGGVLVLDNSERAQYQEAMRLFEQWSRTDYLSHNSENWTTTIWVKP